MEKGACNKKEYSHKVDKSSLATEEENLTDKKLPTVEQNTGTTEKEMSNDKEDIEENNAKMENEMLRAEEDIVENNFTNMELHFETEIELKASDDVSDCKIYACALISGNQIIIADAGNKSVKVVDIKQGRLSGQYRFDSEPFSVAVVNGNLTAVTLPDEKKIVFLNISHSGELTPSHETKVDSKCQGLASNGQKLIVLYQDYVEILNVHGEVINQITHSVWDCLMDIALSCDCKTFYVTDSPLFGNARVYKFDFEGNILATYEDKGLLDVRGFGVTTDGTMLACNYVDNGSIHLISPDCQKIGEVLKCDSHVRYPWCVSYCDETEKLFICNNELELDLNLRNHLKIFHFKFIK